MNTNIAEAIKEEGIETYLKNQQHKSLLRFLTCGSVDDGKSTLIGRLLHDSRQVYEDHLNTLKSESQKIGTTGEKLDFALLVDGLQHCANHRGDANHGEQRDGKAHGRYQLKKAAQPLAKGGVRHGQAVRKTGGALQN